MIDELLQDYRQISLADMSAVRLMNRIDTKFLSTVPVLTQLLELLHEEYFVQDTDGLRLFPYRTLYFDTAAHRMYMMHQSGKKTRQKIRMRTYVNSDMHFLEIKNKNNRGRTKKKRIAIDAITDDTSPFEDFIGRQSDYHSSELTPHLENSFRRITLVNNNFTERLTIDTGLRFCNRLNGTVCALPALTVIELKRDGTSESPALKYFNRLRIKPSGFSKYCMGMVFTSPDLKANRFKERRRYVEKLQQIATILTTNQ